MWSLFGEILGFLAIAFGCGIGAGWLLWRAGRATLPTPRYRQLVEQRDEAAGQLADAASQREAWRADALSQRAALLAERSRLHQSRLDHQDALTRLAGAEAALESVRREAQEATTRATMLAARLQALTIEIGRTNGIPAGLRAGHPGPQPAQQAPPAAPLPVPLPVPLPADLTGDSGHIDCGGGVVDGASRGDGSSGGVTRGREGQVGATPLVGPLGGAPVTA